MQTQFSIRSDSQSSVTSGLSLLIIAVCLSSGCGQRDSKSSDRDAAPSTDTVKIEIQDPKTTQPNNTANYVPDNQCADCHRDLWDSYQQLGMANSAYPFAATKAIEDFDNGHLYHAPSNKHYEMSVEEGQFVMTRYREGADGSRTAVIKRSVDFIIGSGNHSRTYVYRDPSGAMFQLPVVWYSQDSKWGMAPGYDNADHDDFTRPITRECMFCHNAYPEFEPGSDWHGMPDRFPQTLPHGIGCQRCHGPGSEHIRIAEQDSDSPELKDSLIRLGTLDAQAQDDVCNQCHFQPASGRTSFLRQFNRGIYSFQPGQKLADYQSLFRTR